MTFSVKQIAERFRVGHHTVLDWVRQGELVAINVARRRGGRPTWRISEDALAAFETLRAATPPVPRAPRRRKPAADVIEFYP